jgi:hypothetical protein
LKDAASDQIFTLNISSRQAALGDLQATSVDGPGGVEADFGVMLKTPSNPAHLQPVASLHFLNPTRTII